jgi:hypothetical protein
MAQQNKLLIVQRDNQRAVTAAEASRARQLESVASAANLFNVALQEQSLNSQKVAEELDLRAQQFQVDQQKTQQLAEAYGQELGTFQNLFQMAQQGTQEQGAIAAAQGETMAVAAQSGQQNTASAQALQDRIVMDAQNSYQQSNMLFESLSAQSKQNLATTQAMAALQAQLGSGDIELARSMGDFNRSAGLMQLGATRQATILEQQMNNAAIDEQLAAQQYAISTASSADQMNLLGAQKLNSIQRQGSSGPGLFEALPSLVQSGLGVYSAFKPPTALAARTTNPLYNASGGAANGVRNPSFSGGSLSHLPRFGAAPTAPTPPPGMTYTRQPFTGFGSPGGVQTDVTNRLFNIG